jgi:hypothetical protein
LLRDHAASIKNVVFLAPHAALIYSNGTGAVRLLGRSPSVNAMRTTKLGSFIGKIRENFGGDAGGKVAFAPPTLGSGTRSPYGPFRFETALPKGVPYEIQATSDLERWVTITEDVARGPVIVYVDSDAAKHKHRFYRMVANEVHSANIIGYASTILPPGFSLIANPLDATSNTIAELLKDWPDGTTLNKFDTRLFRLSDHAVKHGKWTKPGEKLMPGEGGIFFNPTPDHKSLNFVGDVMQGNLSVPIPAGFSMRSSLVPLPGRLHEDLGFPIGEGDVIHLFDREQQKYVLYPFEGGKWKGDAPVVKVCEAFWVAKTEAANWTRTIAMNG